VQACRELAGRLLPGEAAQFNLDLVDGEETPLEEVVALTRTAPFFGARRLVIVRHAPYFAGRGKKAAAPGDGDVAGPPEGAKEAVSAGEKSLLEYLRNPSKTVCLVFETGLPADRGKKIFQAVKAAGEVIEFTRPRKEELVGWLLRRAAREGKKMAPAAADLLISRAGTGMTLLANELQKLIVFAGEREIITREDVLLLSPRLTEENIFAVVDSLGERRAQKALAGIRDLLAAGEPPPVILAMVARQFRLLLQAKELAAKGAKVSHLAEELKVPLFVAKKITQQSAGFSSARLEEILRRLLEMDVAVKTGGRDFYPAFEDFVISLLAG
jgi:DNA polymerase-3 subunit delta